LEEERPTAFTLEVVTSDLPREFRIDELFPRSLKQWALENYYKEFPEFNYIDGMITIKSKWFID
jgi:hypothetical protein